MEDLPRAAYDVEVYENELELLVSVHRECWYPWDWRLVAKRPVPPMPPRLSSHEDDARRAAAAFSPSVVDRALGREQSKREQLAETVALARLADESDYVASRAEHRLAVESWEWFGRIAQGILSENENAYRAAAENLFPFDELRGEYGTEVSIEYLNPSVVVTSCQVRDVAIVPPEERSLAPNGTLCVNPMAVTKRWSLYRDHVCSCAIRVARETFALLPLSRAVVNVSTRVLNPSTGRIEQPAILGVNFTRGGLERLNLDAIEASDSIRDFGHRMKFEKGAGFEPVVPIHLTDTWEDFE